MCKNNNIWIFHHYATPPTMNGFTRPYDFGINLKEYGYDVTVFASSFLHFSNENLIVDKDRLYITNNDTEIPFVFINSPSSSNIIKRLNNMASYYKGLFKTVKDYKTKHKSPDLIIASSPHPLTMIAGIKIAKKLEIPCICEVRDFWPEVFFIGGLLKEDGFIGKLLIKGEHWIYKNADSIVYLKEGDINYIKDKKWDLNQGGDLNLDKFYYINNGVDIEEFERNKRINILDDPDLNSNKFNIVYTGAIRPVNNVGNILDTAILLKKHMDLQFLIYGEGSQLEILKQRIIDENINNVKIKGHVDKKYIPYILSKSSLNILNYSQNKYNWSRGNSSNKLFEYMASGKPIISTVKMGYCPLEKYKCGISLDEDKPEFLARAILKIFDMPAEKYKEMSNNAMLGAKDFDYRELTKKLIKVVENQLL